MSKSRRSAVFPISLLVLFLIALDWMGAFFLLESWFAHQQAVTAKVERSTCVRGQFQTRSRVPCWRVTFLDAETGDPLAATCRRGCMEKIGLIVDEEQYRLLVSDLPLLRHRVIDIEYPQPYPAESTAPR